MVDLEEIAACLDLDATVGFGGSARHLGEVLIHRDNNDEAVRDVSIVEVVMEQTAVVEVEVLERARCEAIDAAAAECSDASIARSILSLRASCHQALLRPSLSLLNTKPARERTGWIVGFIIMAQGVAKPRRLQRRGASLAAPSSGISVECSAASSFSLPRHFALLQRGFADNFRHGLPCLGISCGRYLLSTNDDGSPPRGDGDPILPERQTLVLASSSAVPPISRRARPPCRR